MSLEDRIKKHEGLRLKPYRDTKNVLTVGYGHNLEEGIPQHIADALLEYDILAAITGASTFRFYSALDAVRQEIIIEMVFQMGRGRVAKFKRMVSGLNDGDYEWAADEMLDSKWAREDSPGRALYLANAMRLGEFEE